MSPISAPCRILFLAANPADTARIDLDVEMREVQAVIDQGRPPGAFELVLQPAVRVSRLQALIDTIEPAIVHFGGHGDDELDGIVFLDDRDRAYTVPIEPLARVLGTRKGVVLNACRSAVQAEAIARHGAWTVGMAGSLDTEHAVVFARAFYGKLARGGGVEDAFEAAKTELELAGHEKTAQLARLFNTSGRTSVFPRVDAQAETPVPPSLSPEAPDVQPIPSRPISSGKGSGQRPAVLNAFGEGDVAGELPILPDLYFEHIDFPRKALSDKINLIIGRRGAGKSALANWLGFARDGHARHYGVYVNVSQPVVFAPTVTALARKLLIEDHGIETLSMVWQLALMHALMVETLKDPHLTGRSGSFAMDAYLKGKQISTTQSPSAVIQRVFQMVANAGHVTAANVISTVHKLAAEDGYAAWRRILSEYLKSSRQRAVIVIDTLEECNVKEPAMQMFMASLSHAVSTLSKGGAGDGVEIKLFIAAEVAQSLEDTAILNIGKTFDRALFMHWRRKDLLRLMCWRLMYHLTRKYPQYCPPALRRYDTLDWSDHAAIVHGVWNKFFPEQRVGKYPVDTFAYLSRFTQLRPRQFVLLGNAIVQRAHENGTFPVIQESDISAGVADMVGTLASEVLSSYRDVYEQAHRIVGTLANWRDMESFHVGLTYGNVDTLAAQAKGMCNNEEFWRLLLETGVLGVVTEETDLYIEARFEYAVRQRLVPSANGRFVVHPMFYPRLGIRPPREAKPVFPIGPEDIKVDF